MSIKKGYILIVFIFSGLCLTSFMAEASSGPTRHEFGAVADIDGNNYRTIIIGSQEWMAENLRVTHYNNNDAIPSDNDIDWESTNAGAYTIYPFDLTDGLNSEKEVLAAYGALYNWYAVDDNRGLCPAGWHVPSDEDWIKLSDYLGDELSRSFGRLLSQTGGKLKTEIILPGSHPGWYYPNTGATNETGFSAVAGGSRFGDGGYGDIGYHGAWWSATYEPVTSWTESRVMARFFMMYYHYDELFNGKGNKRNQFSVRCIRNVNPEARVLQSSKRGPQPTKRDTQSVLHDNSDAIKEHQVSRVTKLWQPGNPVRLILDTDMMTDCDDVAALGILHKLADFDEAEILAVMVSSKYPVSASVVDVVNTYYGRPDIPLGAPKKGTGFYTPVSVFLDSLALEFPHRLKSNDHAPDAVTLYREILASQPDSSVVIVTIGYSSNIDQLLKSRPDGISDLCGSDLVEKKIKVWINMGGNFPVDMAIDNVNFTRDCRAAWYAINNWPGRIVFAGREIGHSIHTGDRIRDTPVNNPVRRSYELHRGRAGRQNWDHHTADLSAVLLAVRGLSDYWDIEDNGYIDLQEDCSFIWRKKPGGRHAYIIKKMDRTELGNIMEELMTAPPALK
jgi:uncharacterized protein (TIGR02145 family)